MIRTDHVEVGTRVSYEDAANPRREGRVVAILRDGREYRVRWDDPAPRVLGGNAAVAIGKFRPDGPLGYRANSAPLAPLRVTREEAVADEAEYWAERDGLTCVSDLRQHGWHVLADLPGSPFDGAEIIASYTRADAIRDGVVVPTPDLVPDEPDFARDAGWAVPVALTTAAANLVIPTDREAQEAGQSAKGRLWDVLSMARMYGARRDANEWLFPCIFWLAGAEREALRKTAGQKTLHLKAAIGPDDDGSPVLTIMLRDED